ncbi:hypothetical protein ACQEVS_07525 [Streptomyces sp. CA-181903]|uniref:hypothetical protein n=1 Tax=Streptomyces sp. CA-181903 TaxID=3240055 RepID=UPI003D94196F
MRRIVAAVFAALITVSLAGITGSATAAAPTTVTANQCMLGGGDVRAISPTVRVCVGGIYDGQRVVG